MTRNLLIALMTALAGCGVDTLGTAAVGAATKAEEAHQAQQLKEDIRKRVEAAQQAQQQSMKDADATSRGEAPAPPR
jgi:hypothetical protein